MEQTPSKQTPSKQTMDVVVEVKNVHDGQGNKLTGVERGRDGRALGPAEVYTVDAEFARAALKTKQVRKANDDDRAVWAKHQKSNEGGDE